MLLRWLSEQHRHPILLSLLTAAFDFILWVEIANVAYATEFWFIFRFEKYWRFLVSILLMFDLDPALVWNFPGANFFWAGMVPAMWLWLMFLATTLSILGQKSSWILKKIIPRLDLQHHPIRSIGYVAAVAVTAVYAFGVIVL
jgi:hypothetical protein